VNQREADAQHAEGRSRAEDIAEKLSVQFNTREAFGNFCVLLDRDHIPFGLAGLQTVLLAKEQLDHLPKAFASFYQKCLREGLITELLQKTSEKRMLTRSGSSNNHLH
jgi:hypothetical protein